MPNPSPTSLTPIHHLITIKLTRENYLLWKAQVVPYLKGQHLYGYLDGSTPAPPQSLTIESDGDVQVIQNPDFDHWYLQNQMILSAIISSLSKRILAHVVKFNTSRDVWQALEKMFTSQSRARTMQIQYQLAILKKGNSSIADYFHQFTTLVDTLAATAHALNDFEVISFLLVGLGSEYDSFVTSVTTRVDPLTVDELYGHLLAHELGLEHQQPTVDLQLAGENFATGRGNSCGGSGSGSSFQYGSGPSSSTQKNYRGCGRGNSSPTNHPVCQVCHKPGHTALKCYHRFDNSYSTDPSNNMHALLTTPQTAPDLNWYPDSGATHHLTADLANLNVKADKYHGLDQICIGNGLGLTVKHIGSTHLSTPTSSFLLHDVLHVPHITKNLISIQKFTTDTNTSIEFHPTHFFVKDCTTGKVLLHGLSNDGLYLFPPAFNKIPM